MRGADLASARLAGKRKAIVVLAVAALAVGAVVLERRPCGDGGGALWQALGARRRPVERETGFEPATPCLEGRHSTAELLPLGSLPYRLGNDLPNYRRLDAQRLNSV